MELQSFPKRMSFLKIENIPNLFIDDRDGKVIEKIDFK